MGISLCGRVRPARRLALVKSFSTSIAIIYTKTDCNDINIEILLHHHVNSECQQHFDVS